MLAKLLTKNKGSLEDVFFQSYWMGRGETEREGFSFRRIWSYLTRSGYSSLTEEDQAAAMDMREDANIESEPLHLKLGIRIEKLTKVDTALDPYHYSYTMDCDVLASAHN